MMRRPWNPWGTVDQLRGEANRVMGRLFGNTEGLGLVAQGQPALNVWEREDALMVELEVPGIKQEQLDLSVVENELTVKVCRPDAEQADVTYHRRERPVGVFTRVVHLPMPVEAEKVTADLRDGVLTITLPKAEAAKPRKISVSAGQIG